MLFFVSSLSQLNKNKAHQKGIYSQQEQMQPMVRQTTEIVLVIYIRLNVQFVLPMNPKQDTSP